MGHILPGGRFRRYGETLLNADTQSSLVPHVKPLTSRSLTGAQGRMAAARSVTAAEISRTAPTFNDPRYTFTTLSIPTDLRTLNGLYRFFDDTDPVVGNTIRLHCEFPLSRISLREVGDPVIQHHYEDMWDRIQLDKLLFDIGLEYWRIGNVFPYGAWNVDDMMWDQFVILNPDYVTVEGTYLNQRPFVKLQPDEHLKKIVTTGQPKYLYDQLPSEIVKYVRMGQEIPLSPQNVFHIAHNKSPYETLGRSIIKRILKSLIYEDRMSMANFAIATRQTIPITVVKVGDPNSGWVPNDEELAEVQEMLSAREVDPNFTIIYHWGIDIQFYGASGKIWNLTNEFNRIMKWKMLGLGISEAILTGGSSYATAYAQLEVLRQRYLHFQQTLQSFVYRGIFEPVANACGFYKTNDIVSGKYYNGRKFGKPMDPPETDLFSKHAANFNNENNAEYVANMRSKSAKNLGEKTLVYPKLDWDLLSLSNDVQYRNFLMNFDRLFPGQRKIADSTFYQAAKLDKDAERGKLAKEFKENLEDQLRNAKVEKEYRKKFEAAGVPFPADKNIPQKGGAEGTGAGGIGGGIPGAAPGGTPGTPGAPGGMKLAPGQPPPVGGTGGGNLMGSPAMPNAPIGKNNYTGNGTKTPGVPRNPEASRMRSMEIQKAMTQSSLELEKELAEEVKQLRKANAAAGIKVDKIDEEIEATVKSHEDSSDSE